jgi:hypothetical protein
VLLDDRLGTLNSLPVGSCQRRERLSKLVITQKGIPTEMVNEMISGSMGVQMIFVVSEGAGEVGWIFVCVCVVIVIRLKSLEKKCYK